MAFETVKAALEQRGYTVQVFATGAEAAAYLDSAIDGMTVGIGGSGTIRAIGAYELLEQHNTVYWHWKQEPNEARKNAMTTDVYLTSVNALAETGEMVNIDGTGNRAAGLIYGPHEAIVILGKNKIVSGLDEAIERIKRAACPTNARRLGLDTPCAKTDKCYDCRTPARMCNVTFIHEGPTRPVKAFHVLIVKEDLGL